MVKLLVGTSLSYVLGQDSLLQLSLQLPANADPGSSGTPATRRGHLYRFPSIGPRPSHCRHLGEWTNGRELICIQADLLCLSKDYSFVCLFVLSHSILVADIFGI